MALGMFSVATAANGDGGKKLTEPVKKETVKAKKVEVNTNANEAISVNSNEGELKTVTCYIYVDGDFEEYTYSCFFCWGGSQNGCVAEGCAYYVTCG